MGVRLIDVEFARRNVENGFRIVIQLKKATTIGDAPMILASFPEGSDIRLRVDL